MNWEQLNVARQARWSQNGEARLTLDSAKEWLDAIGFCAYLPAPTGTPPFASFVEAVVGRPARIPSAGERGRAADILLRLIESSAAVPLKFSASSGEQPDFIASADALGYIYALRGNRNPKVAPPIVGNDKVTPLALHCWQAIQQQGPLDVSGLQQILGQDVTQQAILRALHDLWSGVYAFPVIAANGAPMQWDLFSRRFPKQVTTGANMGHAEAQSAMVSLYIHAAVAAPEDVVLTALAPFASQSKLREILRGLGSMRQLDIVNVAGRAHVCLQGGLLPETVARLSEEQLSVTEIEPEIATSNGSAEELQPGKAAIHADGSEMEAQSVPKKFTPKKFVPRKPEFRRAQANVESKFRGRGDRRESQSAGFDRQAPRKPADNEFGRGDAKPSQQRKSYSGGAGSARGERGQPRRWGKPRPDAGWSAPKFKQRNGERPQKFQRPSTPTGEGKPWPSQRDASGRGERADRAPKTWQRKNFRDFSRPDASDRDRQNRFPSRDRRRTEDDSRRPNRTAGERTEFSRSGPSSDRKPWKNRSAGQKSSGFTRPGFSSRRPQRAGASSEEEQFSRSKPRHEPQTGERDSRSDRANGEPSRRGKSIKSGKSAEKRNGKPFWAKPAHGGKGSSTPRRTNRSGGKGGPSNKKGGKRK